MSVMDREVPFTAPVALNGDESCWSVDVDVPFIFDAVLLSQQPWPRLTYDAAVGHFLRMLDKNDAPIEKVSLRLDFSGKRLVAYTVVVHVSLMVQLFQTFEIYSLQLVKAKRRPWLGGRPSQRESGAWCAVTQRKTTPLTLSD